MPPGRISERGLTERDHLEAAQVILLAMSLNLDEVELRVRQSIRRTHFVDDVLDPAIDRLAEMHRDLQTALSELKAAWQVRQAQNWRKDVR